MDLSVRTSIVEGVTVVAVAGEVDVSSAPTVQEQLDPLLGRAPYTVVVDMSEVSFLDSTGLGALVAALKHAEENGGGLPLAGVQDRVLKLFRITGLDSVFVMEDSVEAAVSRVQASPAWD